MDGSFIQEVDQLEINPLNLFCSSIDSLRGLPIDQFISAESDWSARPCRAFKTNTSYQTSEREALLQRCRRGIPPCLRCASWIINVVSAANPKMSKSECEEYGTLMKVRVFDHGWDLVLKSIFPDESDLERADILDLGLGHDNIMSIIYHDHGGNQIPTKGIKRLIQVLRAARDSLGVEFCPLLPDITCLLLSYMPESYAFATIRQMVVDDSSYFLAVSKIQYFAWCKTFSDLMNRCFPQTFQVMEQIGALTPVGLEPILKRFFVTLLLREHVMRIMDIYTGEGAHAIFRFGTTLCCLSHAHLGDSVRVNCDNAAIFWEGVRRFAHSKHFQFDVFIQHQAYGIQKSFRVLSRPIFPRPDFVARMIANNEAWAEEYKSDIPLHTEVKSLGLLERKVPIVLAKDSTIRFNLAKWLPTALQSTKLDIIYSSSVHGRSVEIFYRCCSSSKHTITLMEVLDSRQDTIIGMYATQTWHNNPNGYGDGGCCLFRLRPNPECFRFKINGRKSTLIDDINLVPSSLNDTRELMISGDNFISMGIGEDGSSGLRLNEDLTRGSTSSHITSGKELVDVGIQVFEVGLIEVYRFIREVDNKPVDGDFDPWKGLFD